MSKWRLAVVAGLVVVPFLVLAGLGSYFLWTRGLGFVVWWPLTACFALGYGLALYWQRKRQLLRAPNFTPPRHWTDRDHGAWELVEARAKTAVDFSPDKFTDLQTYIDTAKEMVQELARFYHPGARDPVGGLTLPEMLTVVELAAHDLEEMVDQYLPGGHLLTIDDWRRARQITDWYQTANRVYWIVSALFSPVNTGIRYAASQFGMARPLELLQQNLYAWFYTAYVHQLGTYLIDLNSGRLRIGARRYRELLKPAEAAAPEPGAPDPAEQVRQITLTVVGQVKAGKSSLINALLGEQKALADVLPATAEITRYELQPPGIPTRLVLLDTVGYGHAGPREDQLRATEDAARQSDLLLLVLHARNPARQADLELLQKLQEWFRSRPELKMPPILGILSHIDLLTPAVEWAPPYNWTSPQRPKEHHIHQAWEAARHQFGQFLVGIVPLCTAEGKVHGVDEWFLPTLAELLDDAHAVALLRVIRAETNTGKVRKVFQQLLQAGKQIAVVLLENLPGAPSPR